MSVAAALPNLGPTFGALYSGSIVSTILFGFTTNQAYIYYKKYFKTDAVYTQSLKLKYTKSLIVLALARFLDLFQVALLVHMTWVYLVAGYDSPAALSTLVWVFTDGIFGILGVLVFYTMQLWRHDIRHWATSSGNLFVDPSVATLTTRYFQWLLGTKCVISVLADCVITAATCYYLHASRTGFTKTNVLINLLSIYTINRGVLAMVWEAIVMITFLTMKIKQFHTTANLIFAALHLMLGKRLITVRHYEFETQMK
ncbi:hypothetical protein BU17DRAFT_64854 [Hysterangium stoloniferum]|nr:hypothetical protein BU17DRAFT_64854 [Hysterangium stoloniferum]